VSAAVQDLLASSNRLVRSMYEWATARHELRVAAVAMGSRCWMATANAAVVGPFLCHDCSLSFSVSCPFLSLRPRARCCLARSHPCARCLAMPICFSLACRCLSLSPRPLPFYARSSALCDRAPRAARTCCLRAGHYNHSYTTFGAVCGPDPPDNDTGLRAVPR